MLTKIKHYAVVGVCCFVLGLVTESIVLPDGDTQMLDVALLGETQEQHRIAFADKSCEPSLLEKPVPDSRLPNQSLAVLEKTVKKGLEEPMLLLQAYYGADTNEKEIQSRKILMNLSDDAQHDIATHLIEDEDQANRLLAYQLIKSNPQAVVPEQIENALLQNSYAEVDPQTLAANIAALRNVRHNSVNAARVKERLYELSTHSSPQVRANAIDALGYQDNSENALPAVVNALNDQSSEVRLSAAETLFNFDTLESSDYDELFMIASDMNEDLRVRQEVLILLDEHSRQATNIRP